MGWGAGSLCDGYNLDIGFTLSFPSFCDSVITHSCLLERIPFQMGDKNNLDRVAYLLTEYKDSTMKSQELEIRSEMHVKMA